MSIHIHRDAWGIPHLRADDPHALAFAQGLVTARDRAWQLEIEHRRLLGTAAAVLGPGAAPWDVLARRARLAHTARRCFLALDEPTRAWVTAYADGVNAGLPDAARRAPEFATAGAQPSQPSESPESPGSPGSPRPAEPAAPTPWRPWVPLGIWLATHLLFTGMPAKLWRAEVTRRLGPEAVGWFARTGASGLGSAGSNGWLLAGERTATGAALLAGDPHRLIEDPGVYQQIRLACPAFDVLGFAVPGVPGIPHFGHTGHVAWGITHAMADYQDLFEERLRRVGGGVEALGPDGWRPAEHGVESVAVAGGDPVPVEVIETERGPVLLGGPDDPSAISLRHVPRVTGDLGFAALPKLLHARTVADVDAACEAWVEPVNVLLAADTAGGALHRVAGRVPARHPGNRLRPVPAWEAGHAWRPGAYEPLGRGAVTGGLAVMANEPGLAAPLGVEFVPDHRHRRIRELLERDGAGTGWTAEALDAVHADTHAGGSRRLLDLLAALDELPPAAAALQKRLLAWDQRMAADSTDATAYAEVRAACVRHLAEQPAFAPLADLAAGYPEPLRPWVALRPRIAHALDTLLTPGAVPGLDPAAVVRAAVTEAADATTAATSAAAAADDLPAWGERHRLHATRAHGAAPDAGPLAGDHDCVLATASVPGVTHRCTHGPVARYVWDLRRREHSRWIVPFGAHGTAGHPHHHDQSPLWRAGRLAPVVTDPARLTREATLPAPTPTPAPAPHAAPTFERAVTGLGTVALVPVDPLADLDLIHGWVTAPRARFWGMAGLAREDVLEIYEHLDALPTHHAYLIRLDGVPLGLLQTYDPAHDEVGAHYDAREGDIGIHLLLAPPRGALRHGLTDRVAPVLVDSLFADPRVRRVVTEPDLRNERAVARALRSGFELGPVLELPHKRARLAFLARP